MARILVIDDDASLLQMMSLMLQRAGHEVLLADDGQEGLYAAHADDPELAIVDIMMPDVNGYEVCRRLRTDPETKHIPLLVLTALSQPEQRELAMDAGADGFVTKPVTRDDLLEHVGELLVSGPQNMPVPKDEADDAPQTEPTEAAPPLGLVDEAPTAARTARSTADTLPLVAVMGLNAGVGGTTVAVNLGVGLAQSANRICIIDLEVDKGHVASHLGLAPPRATWLNLLDITRGADKRIIARTLMLEQNSGVAILAAPPQPTNQALPEDTLQYMLEVLAEGFAFTVADLSTRLESMSTTALYNARDIVLVVGEDPTNLSLAHKMFSAIREMDLPGEIHLVLNHTRPRGISTDDVMETFRYPVAASILYEDNQYEALQQGIPLILRQPDSLFAQAMQTLIRQL